jgi:Mrp family chromosome partitioning ATPase
VIKKGKTNTHKALEAKKELELAGAEILGVVLNNK